MKKTLRLLAFNISFALCIGCGSDDNIEPIAQNSTLTVSVARAPAQGAICEGTDIGDSTVEVTFTSVAVNEAEMYMYTISDSTGNVVETLQSTKPSVAVVLEKSSAYSYTVTTTSGQDSVTGPLISFTTPGIAVANYVPFATNFIIDLASDELSFQLFDQENDSLSYTLSSSDTSNFSSEIILAENISAAAGDLIVVTGLGLIPGTVVWFKISVVDSYGNQSLLVRSFNE